MPINIKEIFKSDLDPNNTEWWSEAKVDKLNFNFNQLTDGGMIGPAGFKGPDGDMGVKGILGEKGPQGPRGSQGIAGEDALREWVEFINESNTHRTIAPNFDSNNIEYQPTRFWIGYTNTEQAENLGFDRPIQVLKSFEVGQSQLRLNIESGVNFDFKLNEITVPFKFTFIDKSVFEIGKLSPASNNLTYQYKIGDNIQIYRNNTNQFLTISNTHFNFKSDNNLLNDVAANGSFKYNNLANTGNILISTDNVGNAQWANKFDVFGSFPVGSIISIPEFVFNDNNFHLDTTQNGDDPVQFIFGRGKSNTVYEGWYLCHGQTWTDGVASYDVPELNGFDVSINANGGDQSLFTETGDNILIGGADFSMDATYSGDGLYNIQLSDDTVQLDTIKIDSGTGLYQSKQIHIVYLQQPEFYWETTGQTTPTDGIELSYGNQTKEVACSVQLEEYRWTGGSTDWVTGDMTNIQLYTNSLQPAANGWYARAGLARYWSGTEFTQTHQCAETVELVYAEQVFSDDINGDTNSKPFNNYLLDGNRIYDSSILQNPDGTNAPAGWYRERTDNFNDNYRRYWNGTQFLGESIKTAYVYIITEAGVESIPYKFNTNYDTVCSIFTNSHTAFFSSDASIDTLSGSAFLQKVHDATQNQNGHVYVADNWNYGNINTLKGAYPLMKVRSQNAPGQTLEYTAMSNPGNNLVISYKARINGDSTIRTPQLCN